MRKNQASRLASFVVRVAPTTRSWEFVNVRSLPTPGTWNEMMRAPGLDTLLVEHKTTRAFSSAEQIEALQHAKKLTRLRLVVPEDPFERREIERAFRHKKSLTHLHMRLDSELDDAELALIAGACPNLTVVNLQSPWWPTGLGAFAQHPWLRILDLETDSDVERWFDEKQLASVFETCPNLLRLQLVSDPSQLAWHVGTEDVDRLGQLPANVSMDVAANQLVWNFEMDGDGKHLPGTVDDLLPALRAPQKRRWNNLQLIVVDFRAMLTGLVEIARHQKWQMLHTVSIHPHPDVASWPEDAKQPWLSKDAGKDIFHSGRWVQ